MYLGCLNQAGKGHNEAENSSTRVRVIQLIRYTLTGQVHVSLSNTNVETQDDPAEAARVRLAVATAEQHRPSAPRSAISDILDETDEVMIQAARHRTPPSTHAVATAEQHRPGAPCTAISDLLDETNEVMIRAARPEDTAFDAWVRPGEAMLQRTMRSEWVEGNLPSTLFMPSTNSQTHIDQLVDKQLYLLLYVYS